MPRAKPLTTVPPDEDQSHAASRAARAMSVVQLRVPTTASDLDQAFCEGHVPRQNNTGGASVSSLKSGG
jgi:hypothetical protein